MRAATLKSPTSPACSARAHAARSGSRADSPADDARKGRVRRLICRSMAPQAVEPAHKAEEGLAREPRKQLPQQAFGTGRRDKLVPAIRRSVARPHGDSARVDDFNCQKHTSCFGQLES